MRMIFPVILSLVLSGAAAADARADLADEADINAGLLVVAAADKIRRSCDHISARFFVARNYAEQLNAMAEKRGYTRAEIDAYINDSDNKALMRERRNAYFKSKGASNLDHDSLCRLGMEEIKNKTRIGSLLKAK